MGDEVAGAEHAAGPAQLELVRYTLQGLIQGPWLAVQHQFLREHRKPHLVRLAVDGLRRTHLILVEVAAELGVLVLLMAVFLRVRRLPLCLLPELHARRLAVVVIMIMHIQLRRPLLRHRPQTEIKVEEPVERLDVLRILDERGPQGVPHHPALTQPGLLQRVQSIQALRR